MGVNITKATNNCRIGHAIVAGAAADTDIAIAGIKTTDQIIGVGHFETAASIATLTDQTAASSITSDGNIQCTNDTASDTLMVLWQSSE